MSCPDALWLLYLGEIRVDGGVRGDDLRLLAEKEDVVSDYVRCFGIAIPAICKDCVGTDCVECGRCHRGDRIDCFGVDR